MSADDLGKPEEPLEIRHLPLAQILTFWKPGSGDENWTWADEYSELIGQTRTAELSALEGAFPRNLRREEHPIMLGNDGRVWDGHHRIVIAIFKGHSLLPVHIIQPITGEARA